MPMKEQLTQWAWAGWKQVGTGAQQRREGEAMGRKGVGKIVGREVSVGLVRLCIRDRRRTDIRYISGAVVEKWTLALGGQSRRKG
ncbi:hypothetical protein BY996DRAFT_6563549 [Phakopsora pachyrhizi]|nr:hypothetical protein BY996DRAFT_6563549 [Phakopsora pachyrhizi]